MTSLANIRADFPTLHQNVGPHPLVYLDNAATIIKQKVPRQHLTTANQSLYNYTKQ